jgi:hypothetical protein
VCTRCSEDTIECVYSRSGTIRRQKKRKRDGVLNNASGHASESTHIAATATESTGVQPHLTSDIEATRGLLHGLGGSHEMSLGALTSLSEACASVWHNAMEFDSTSKGFFLFKDQAESWVDSKTSSLYVPASSTKVIDATGQLSPPHSGVATQFWHSDLMMRYYGT